MIHLYPAHWQSASLCYHLLSGRNCDADSAEMRAILVGSLWKDQPNSQAKRRLWFTDHNLYMERSVGFRGPLLLLVCCEGQIGPSDSSWLGCQCYIGDLKLWVYCIYCKAAFCLPFAQGTHVTYTVNADMLIPVSRGKFPFYTWGARALRWCRKGRGWITR